MEATPLSSKRHLFSELLKELRLTPGKKLTIMDSRVITIRRYTSSVHNKDVINQFFINVSLRDHLACEKLVLREKYKKHESNFESSDILFVILSQSDPFLLQDLLRKLTICNAAVPVMLPDINGTNVTFLQWGLRTCSVNCFVKETSDNIKINCLEHPFLTISFLRIGDTAISKSNILNKMCASLAGFSGNEQFRPFLEENPWSVLGKGIVECFWLADSFNDNNKNTGVPVCLRNVRGDASVHRKQLHLSSLTSSILIIFADLESKLNGLNELLKKSTASHILIISSLLDVHIDIPVGKKVRKVSTDSLSELEISTVLHKSVSSVINKCIISKPLAEEGDLFKTLKILTDEEESSCKTAKLIATEISTKMREANTEWTIDTVFPLLMMEKDWVFPRCMGKADETKDEYLEFHKAETIFRHNQRDSELSEPILRIIHTILDYESIGLWLILWLKILFDIKEQCYMKFSAKTKISSRAYAGARNRLEWGTNVVNNDTFLGELQQVIECSKQVPMNVNPAKSFPRHSKFFANFLLHGHTLNIADFDSKFVPTAWIRRLFADLQEMTGEGGIRVVSIVGDNRSGKSKLLNRLFGVDFPEGYEHRSIGLRLSLVPVESCNTLAAPFDFCLVIDTEGLNIKEGSHNLFETRWFFVSMMATSLSDVIIIHTCSTQNVEAISQMVGTFVKTARETDKSTCSRKLCLIYQTDSYSTTEFETKTNEGHDQNGKAKVFKIANRYPEETVVNFVFWNDLRRLSMSSFDETVISLTARKGMSLISFRQRLIDFIATSDEPVFMFDELGEKVIDLLQIFQKGRFENIHSQIENKVWGLGELQQQWNRIQISIEKHVRNACKRIQCVPYDQLNKTLDEDLNTLTILDKRNMLDIESFKNKLQKSDDISHKESLSTIIENLKTTNKSRIKSLRHKMVKVKKTRREERLRILRDPKDEDPSIPIEVEIDSFLRDIRNEQSESDFREKWDTFTQEMRRKYPIIELREQQKITEHQIMSLLDESGYDLQDIAPNQSFHELSRIIYPISSEKDLLNVYQNFHTVSDENERLMQNLYLDLQALCKRNRDFSSRTDSAIGLFQRFVEKSDLPVDRVTLFTFLFSQYISKGHLAFLEEECSSTEIITTMKEVTLNSNKHGQVERPTADKEQFLNVQSKIEYILLRIKTFLSDEEISVLKQSLNEKTVQNYTYLPFNCTTLQRLDIFFHNLLPSLSKYDMDNINSVVDDAKMFIFGKVLAKANLDLSRELNTIFACINKDLKSRLENTAVAFHLSSWSIPLVSLKQKQDKEEDSLARSIERLENITLAKFLCDINVSSDVLLADILCEEIQHSLLRFIEDNWIEYFTAEICSLKSICEWKRKAIRLLLCGFCEKDDFENLIDVIQNYKNIGKGKFIKLIATIFNEKENSHIHAFAKILLRTKVRECLSALEETTHIFQSQEGCSMEFWLHTFVEKMLRHSIYFHRQNHLEILKKCTKLNNIKTFTMQCERKVLELNSLVLGMLRLPPAGNTDYTVTWFYEMPNEKHLSLIKTIKGCTDQCPLCGAICEHDLQGHSFHNTPLHYPMCFNGGKCKTLEGIWELNINTCKQDSMNPEKLKKWKIPQEAVEPITFWKYMLHRFSLQLKRFYNCNLKEIPPEWYRISQSEALKSLNEEH